VTKVGHRIHPQPHYHWKTPRRKKGCGPSYSERGLDPADSGSGSVPESGLESDPDPASGSGSGSDPDHGLGLDSGSEHSARFGPYHTASHHRSYPSSAGAVDAGSAGAAASPASSSSPCSAHLPRHLRHHHPSSPYPDREMAVVVRRRQHPFLVAPYPAHRPPCSPFPAGL
jgi:hypothetical protein